MRARLASIVLVWVLSACAAEETRIEYDPLEPLNRGVYAVNDTLDRALLKPVARGYKTITPGFIRRGVTNFSSNLFTPRSAINNFLQGKPKRGLDDLARFLLNSTLGIGGLLDLASDGGLEKYDEDFGQTLAVWGVPDGPYVMIPFLGPRTLRDAFATPVDFLSDPLYHYENTSVRDKIRVLRGVNLRSRLLAADRLLDDSKDRYITLRESYLQNREYVIYDGDPPEDDDFYDDFEDVEDEDAVNVGDSNDGG